MQLSFYLLNSNTAQILLKQGLNIFYYDTKAAQRLLVDESTFEEKVEQSAKSLGHFQMEVRDIKFVQNEEMTIEIAEMNKDTLIYVDRHNARIALYASFFKEDWLPLLELSKAFSANDFLPLLNIIQADLASDPQDINVFSSTVSDCLEKILRRDSNLSRMICFSYCCYKHMKFNDRALLYDFLGAVILKDLGLTQNRDAATMEKNEIFYKHSYYSLFLIKKLPIELPQRCYFFILDHHESQDGSGFPRQKTGNFYHPLCDTLKATENLFITNKTTDKYLADMRSMIEFKKIINSSLIECLSVTCSYLAS